MGILRVGRHMTIPPLMQVRTFAPRSAAAAASWWYVAGKTCVAAYQPKGADDLADSYINLANPGTNNAAPGSAPSFAAATGWTFDGNTKYLTTGIVPANGYSLILRYSGLESSVGWFAGAYNGTGNNRLSVGTPNGMGKIEFGSGKTVEVLNGGVVIAQAVLAVAGQQGYRDGSSAGGAISAWDGGITAGIDIANLGGFNETKLACSILAVAIYSDTLSAAQVATVSAAMAAL